MLASAFGVLALSVASGFSLSVGSPRRASPVSYTGSIDYSINYTGHISISFYSSFFTLDTDYESPIQGSQILADEVDFRYQFEVSGITSSYIHMDFYHRDEDYLETVRLYFASLSAETTYSNLENDGLDYVEASNSVNWVDNLGYHFEFWGEFEYYELDQNSNSYLQSVFVPSYVPSYSVTANYVYCSHTVQSGEKYLPSEPYTSSTISNPYVFRVDASQGCRFRKDGSAVSSTGGITINSILYDGLPASVGSNYATWIAIELNLPLADCSITFNAINQFAVNKNLDACTTTIPDVYSVDMAGTYRIEALSGYAFDSNLTQYTITGIVVNSVAYADNIYGHLYRTIVLDLTFPATNYANVTATASPYSADYAQGFNDGEASGLELKGGLMDLIPNVFASIGAFFFTFSGVNFMGINLLAIVGIVVSVGLIGVVIKVALK